MGVGVVFFPLAWAHIFRVIRRKNYVNPCVGWVFYCAHVALIQLVDERNSIGSYSGSCLAHTYIVDKFRNHAIMRVDP